MDTHTIEDSQLTLTVDSIADNQILDLLFIPKKVVYTHHQHSPALNSAQHISFSSTDYQPYKWSLEITFAFLVNSGIRNNIDARPSASGNLLNLVQFLRKRDSGFNVVLRDSMGSSDDLVRLKVEDTLYQSQGSTRHLLYSKW